MSKDRTPKYPEVVWNLTTLGPPGGVKDDACWREAPLDDYAAMGLTREHVPDLVRLCKDPRPEAFENFGDVHAYRALVFLMGVQAVPDLIGLVRHYDALNADFCLEDLMELLGAMPPEAVRPLAAAYRDQRIAFGARLFLGGALERIAQAHPEARESVVRVMREILSMARWTHPGLVGDAVGTLVELFAVEALPAIRAAFAAGRVDRFAAGKLEHVEREIAMTPAEREAEREARRKKWAEELKMDPASDPVEGVADEMDLDREAAFEDGQDSIEITPPEVMVTLAGKAEPDVWTGPTASGR